MRIAASLLKASVVAAFVFAIAWIRIPVIASNLETVFRAFIGYGALIVILSLTIGFLLASIAAKSGMVRWWSSTAVAAAVGALLGGFFTYRPAPSNQGEVANPFALTFSPWRKAPGFTDDTFFSQVDFLGSVVFGAIVGGVFGLAFWYFYSRNAQLIYGLSLGPRTTALRLRGSYRCSPG